MILTKQINEFLTIAYNETNIDKKVGMFVNILQLSCKDIDITIEIKKHIDKHIKEIQDTLEEEEDMEIDCFYYYSMGSNYFKVSPPL
jgi:chaperonin cofactor prefoldin